MSEPTIYDVARESGFSIKTVSRVINGEKGVRAETVARVEAAIKALDYHPNPAAQRLGGGKLPTIGIVVDSLNDPFFGEVIAVTERRAVELGMDVLVASTGMDETRARTQVERLVRRGVAALIVAPFGDDETARASLPDGIPVVVIDRRCGIDDKDVVRVTDHEGALEAVRHLIAHGHTRIAFLGETAEFTTVQDRLAGYTDALVGAGLTVDPELVETRCWNEEASYPLALAMLAPADAPTAVFATTPLVGLGVLRALKRLDRQDTARRRVRRLPARRADDAAHHRRRPASDRPRPRRLRPPRAPPRRPARARGRDRPAHPPDPARVRRAAAPEGRLVRHPLVVDLGFDLGTTVTKLTALAEDGTKLLDLSVATTWDELGDGRAERDPRAVVAAVEDLLARAAATVGDDQRSRSARDPLDRVRLDGRVRCARRR